MTKTAKCAYADEHPRDHYDAFRRAHGLWADADGNFFAGVFADSPHAVRMDEGVSFVGWVAGTEYADDKEFWKTVPLSDVESIVFMERYGFVLYGEPDGEAAYVAAMGKPSTRKQAPTTGKEL